MHTAPAPPRPGGRLAEVVSLPPPPPAPTTASSNLDDEPAETGGGLATVTELAPIVALHPAAARLLPTLPGGAHHAPPRPTGVHTGSDELRASDTGHGLGDVADLGELAGLDDVEAGWLDDEDGSLLTEYGLLIVVAATVAGVLIQWAGGSQITGLFNALLRAARETVGA